MRKNLVTYFAASALVISLLASCTNAEERVYANAKRPEMIMIGTVDLIGEEILPSALMDAGFDYSPRCCRPVRDSYFLHEQGYPQSAEDITSVLTNDTSLYTITLPDPTDTTFIEPLFGKKMRRHVMNEPQRGCEVVSGVRDGWLRAGVIAHKVQVEFRPGYSTEQLNYEAIEFCLISAVLLLHGLSVEDAMNPADYAVNIDSRGTRIAPDFAKLEAREEYMAGIENGPVESNISLVEFEIRKRQALYDACLNDDVMKSDGPCELLRYIRADLWYGLPADWVADDGINEDYLIHMRNRYASICRDGGYSHCDMLSYITDQTMGPSLDDAKRLQYRACMIEILEDGPLDYCDFLVSNLYPYGKDYAKILIADHLAGGQDGLLSRVTDDVVTAKVPDIKSETVAEILEQRQQENP